MAATDLIDARRQIANGVRLPADRVRILRRLRRRTQGP
jgi:hypothetical protein